MESNYGQLFKMLEVAKNISVISKRPKNYFEVAGYPNYENVASSILAFFFDTNDEHNLKDLWLKSLLECYSNKANLTDSESILSINSFETVVDGITREEYTSDAKRLDIVIPTNNDIVIAIENKLFATVYNPLDSYNEWINKQYDQYSNKLEIILSLYAVKNDEILTGKDSQGNEYRFINITYKELFIQIKNNIGSYIANANEKWLIYMNEFIKNIESFQEENMKLDKEWQSFLEENNSLICDLNNKIQNDNKEKNKLLKNLSESLLSRINGEPQAASTRVYTFGNQSFASHISLVIDITANNGTVFALEPYFMKAGNILADYQHLSTFNVTIWVRGKKCREEGITALEQILTEKQISYDVRISRSWGKCLEIKQFDYSKDINDKEVEDYIFNLWKIIATSLYIA